MHFYTVQADPESAMLQCNRDVTEESAGSFEQERHMVAVTYGTAGAAAAAVIVKPAHQGKSFFARVYDAITRSQMKRAERELARYRHLLPQGFELSGDREQKLGGW